MSTYDELTEAWRRASTGPPMDCIRAYDLNPAEAGMWASHLMRFVVEGLPEALEHQPELEGVSPVEIIALTVALQALCTGIEVGRQQTRMRD